MLISCQGLKQSLGSELLSSIICPTSRSAKLWSRTIAAWSFLKSSSIADGSLLMTVRSAKSLYWCSEVLHFKWRCSFFFLIHWDYICCFFLFSRRVYPWMIFSPSSSLTFPRRYSSKPSIRVLPSFSCCSLEMNLSNASPMSKTIILSLWSFFCPTEKSSTVKHIKHRKPKSGSVSKNSCYWVISAHQLENKLWKSCDVYWVHLTLKKHGSLITRRSFSSASFLSSLHLVPCW